MAARGRRRAERCAERRVNRVLAARLYFYASRGAYVVTRDEGNPSIRSLSGAMGLLRRLFSARKRRRGDVPPTELPYPFSAMSHRAQSPPKAASTSTAPAGLFKRMSTARRVALIAPLVIVGAAAVDLAAMMIYYTIAHPHPMSMRKSEPAPLVRLLARDGSVLAVRGQAHDFMPIDLLPLHVQAAVVATEDRRFYSHYGVDPAGLIRAVFANLRAGRFAQGGSTLTQQLAKNLFLSSERTLTRKIEEFGLALWLELRLSKADILELYLNRVYFGGGAYGIEAASRRYFDKSAPSLTLAEAAIIAGLLKAPSKFSPASSPGAARARGRVVLAKMVDAGLISLAQEQEALQQRIVFDAPKAGRKSGGLEYAVEYVLERLPPLVSAGHAEVIVETTLDAELQRRTGELVAQSLDRQGAALGAGQGAVVVIDREGEIRALVGGRNYAESQYNRAAKARRQPGSAFKPIVYLAAMEAGMSPDTIAYDLPITIAGWSPRNDNGQYLGEMTLRRALAQSVNTVAVRTIQQVGVRKTAAAARRLGYNSDMTENASLALGTSETSLLELTGVYAAFGNGGTRVSPHAIRSVRLSTGEVLFTHKADGWASVIDPQIVGKMNDMLNAAITSGTGRRAALREHPAGGKTGTTQDFKDAWFIGYTAHLTAGVWIGNDDGKPMNKAVGGGLPAEIWRLVMQSAHEGKAPLDLPGTMRRPAGDTDADVASWAAAPAAAAPRVWHVREQLPWSRPQAPGQAQRYPAERIDDRFLDRVLSESTKSGDGPARSKSFLSFGLW